MAFSAARLVPWQQQLLLLQLLATLLFIVVCSSASPSIDFKAMEEAEDSLLRSLNHLAAEQKKPEGKGYSEQQQQQQEAKETDQENKPLNDFSPTILWRDVYFEAQSADTAKRQEMRMNGITAKQQQEILDLHNELRRKEGASNMYKLNWNEKLARLGQQWSERCVFEHGQPPHDAVSVGYKSIGQNIYAHTSTAFKVQDAVQGWYDEKPDYNYDYLTCRAGKVCGHYTAVTWGDTKEVGCGMAFCPSIGGLTKAHYIVCNYGPPGNWGGEKPFLKGKECSKCGTGKFYCNKGLCDHTCKNEGPNCKCSADCKNNGVKRDCSCTCKEGFMGVDCADICRDLSPLCGANPGYPAPFCKMNDPNWAFIQDKCPKMCGKCKAKREVDSEAREEKEDRSIQQTHRSWKRLLNILETELNSAEEKDAHTKDE